MSTVPEAVGDEYPVPLPRDGVDPLVADERLHLEVPEVLQVCTQMVWSELGPEYSRCLSAPDLSIYRYNIQMMWKLTVGTA